MQNELIGDLGIEFSSLPDSPEDLTLEELGNAVSTDGGLGKQSGSLVSRMMSSKMPVGFNITTAKKHLETRWGLGALRQQAVLLQALTKEPPTRLPDQDTAKAFLDGIVASYCQRVGVTPSSSSSSVSVGIDVGSVDPAAIKALAQEQNVLLNRQLELLAEHLQVDMRAGEKARIAAQDEKEALQAEIDLWNDEYGDTYSEKIKPKFDALKARVYDSWWNWARVGATELYFKALSGNVSEDDREFAACCQHIANCSNDVLLHMIETLSKSGGSKTASSTAAALAKRCRDALGTPPVFVPTELGTKPHVEIDVNGNIKYTEVQRNSVNGLEMYVKEMVPDQSPPLLQLKTQRLHEWQYDTSATTKYIDALWTGVKSGWSFAGKYALITGAGAGSIGCDLLQGLLEGGCKVVVTTSRFSTEICKFYQKMYTEYGGREAELVVVPFNQGSKKDVEALVEYVYKTLNWDLDFFIPFAAIPENGRDISSIDSTSELAHRLMLTNLIRMMGQITNQKRKRGFHQRPTQVVLPMSPNHGSFGFDGLYSESKISLETLFNRWHSEGWSDYLSICGCVIGWTRGTGLMSANDIVSEAIEASSNSRTFSRQEMSFNILGALHPEIQHLCQTEPVYADFGGGLSSIPDLKQLTERARQDLREKSETSKAIKKELQLEESFSLTTPLTTPSADGDFSELAKFDVGFPKLPDYDTELKPLSTLNGLLNLDRIVVVTGFAELGPWGNSRTRWEMEAFGDFSTTGWVEMAWIAGKIKHHDGPLKGKSEIYVGWVDAKSGEPIADAKVGEKYSAEILKHSGIRFIDPEVSNNYDPERKEILQEIVIEESLAPFEASETAAKAFKKFHGDKADIFEDAETGQYWVHLYKGATLRIPKAISSTRLVAGQIPLGWDPKRYGIPQDMIDQTEPVTLYTLVCVSEALMSSGITDPYEIYRYVHLSGLANCIGTSSGSLAGQRAVYRDRMMDMDVQNDILQETMLNTTAAWVNMLLLSAAGPIRTPVGACATSVESVQLAWETIVNGKASICLVGGTDDFGEENSNEFGQMKATSNSIDELAHGREPAEMSRPVASTRSGFMEGQGAGVQVIMSAKLAIEMGCPIYAVVAMVDMAADKVGRSVPAPGQGVLSTARELHLGSPSPLLDIQFRKKQLSFALKQIDDWKREQEAELKKEMSARSDRDEEWENGRREHIEIFAQRQAQQARNTWGSEFWQNDLEISPLRGALATFGLTIDDITIASFHGTSTMANDKNEGDVMSKQFAHLGRTRGNPVLGMYQKYLTGHSKAAAGAWMLNGCLQSISTGIVPGNRNADNVDKEFQKFDYLLYPNRTLQTPGIKAFSLTSFGFGQKGAQLIGVHPKYVLAALDKPVYEDYAVRVETRRQKANRFLHRALVTGTVVTVKQHPPFTPEQESAVYLDPTARVSAEIDESSSYAFTTNPERADNRGILKRAPRALSNASGTASPPARSEGVSSDSTQTTVPSSPILTGASTASTVSNGSPDTDEDIHALTTTLLHSAIKASASHDDGLQTHNTRIGVDIESISSFPSSNPNFLDRNFTHAEVAYANAAAGGSQTSLAGTWAAKEAVFKSLGVKGEGAAASLKDIEITRDSESSRPTVQVSFFNFFFRSEHLV